MLEKKYTAKKRFGQNFLIDDSIIERIISCIQPQSNETLVEIGPGLAALTQELLPKVNKLHVIEIDHDVIPILKNKCQRFNNIIVHQADALTFNFSELIEASQKLRIIGNLPYNISTPLLFHLLQYADQIHNMHFMLQLEVVDRICAVPGNKDYGRLSVMMQYYCQVEKLITVPPTAFSPPPKVDSAIIRLVPWIKKPVLADDVNLLEKLVAQAFHMRRKTLRNNLKNLLTEEEFKHLSIDPNLRAEMLTVEQFVKISNFLFQQKPKQA